jgi:hypothetical protein
MMKQIIGLLLAVFLSATAFGQLVKKEMLVIAGETLNKSAKSTPSKLFIGEDMLMLRTGTKAKAGHTVLFDADKEVLYYVNHDEKEITEISKKDVEQITAGLANASAEVNKQLAGLPADQRAAVEKQMKAVLASSGGATEFTTGDKGQVSGWECQSYLSQEDEQKRAEICFATYTALGYDADDFEVMQKLFDFTEPAYSTLQRLYPDYANLFNPSVVDFKRGLPVRSVQYDSGGQPESTTTLKSIEEVALDEDEFKLPKNYSKKNISGIVR